MPILFEINKVKFWHCFFDVDPYSTEVVGLYPTDEYQYHPSICSFQDINTIFFILGVQSQISEVHYSSIDAHLL